MHGARREIDPRGQRTERTEDRSARHRIEIDGEGGATPRDTHGPPEVAITSVEVKAARARMPEYAGEVIEPDREHVIHRACDVKPRRKRSRAGGST